MILQAPNFPYFLPKYILILCQENIKSQLSPSIWPPTRPQYISRAGVLHTMAESIYQAWLWQNSQHCQKQGDDLSFPLSQKTKHGRTLWETCSLVRAHQEWPPSWVWKEGEPGLYLHLPGRERLERMSSPYMTSLQSWKSEPADRKQHKEGDALLHFTRTRGPGLRVQNFDEGDV